ncbi:MAG: haloacid dehalogenase-like hydrolase [Gemmatimonadales bacterium]|nr:haloacid dehalogenase-like hydrolase [Gemmatimonadales bacterium]
MKLVCFDIDGTLVWTDGAGRRAIRRALEDVLGAAGPIDGFRFDGRTDGEIVWRLTEAAGLAVDTTLMDRVLARYVELLGAELAKPEHATHVYPGVRELLDALEPREDCVIGLLTGNVASGARLKLGSAGLDFERFRIGAFGSDSHERTALPALAQQRAREVLGLEVAGRDVVIIGDTPADMACGKGIGARAIGVGTAAYSAEQLMESGAHAAFADLSDTARVMEAVLK